MSFRDFNRRSEPIRLYINGQSFRDTNALTEYSSKPEPLPEVPPKPPVTQNVSTAIPQPSANVVYSQTVRPNISVQAGYTNISRYPKSVYIQQPPPVLNSGIPQTVPQNQRQSQFIYYSQPSALPPSQPPQTPPPQNFVPPPQFPEKPDPSKFVEEYVPTPPPRMVKAKAPAVRKRPDNFDGSTGAFGGTFDDNPDQSTPVADIPDIPVMDNINDYKI